MKLGTLKSTLKAWSNFRLMLVLGSAVTVLSLALGAVVVQAALSDDTDSSEPAPAAQPAGEPEAIPPAGGPAEGTQAPADTNAPSRSNGTLPILDGSADFRISCPAGDVTNTQNTCLVESFGGFAQRVELSCAGLPANLSCSFTPSSVVPRANGSTTFRLGLQVGNVPPGSYVFDVVGRNGNKNRSFRYPWGVPTPQVAVVPPPPAPAPLPGRPAPAAPSAPPLEPTFSFTCGSLSDSAKVPWSLGTDGTTVKINCFLTPLNGFKESVTFTFTQPDDLAKPDTINFILNQLQVKNLFDLRFELTDAVKGLTAEQLEKGVDYPFEVTGTSASGKKLTRPVTLTVTK